MTRVNVVSPKSLSRLHLIAEYKEITRLPNNLKTSLNRKGKPFSMKEIPLEYKLGPGHVKFFFNKMLFLEKRFISLVDEMKNRGYNPKYTDASIFKQFEGTEFYNDYIPTEIAVEINLQRIKERS